MDDLLDQRLRLCDLYDLYGGLLTPKQRRAFELVVLEDCSLSEAAAELSVSRQGAHDLVQRSREHLLSAEEAMGLLAERDRLHGEIEKLVDRYRGELPSGFVEELLGILGRKEGQWDVRLPEG
ncbi:hypothetical protein TheveDRAFT_0326 [Thermanaerovibrio velox DSM 12556]|uniref:UPF0122 protein TheveDRAFT_0326 n=1 Tax=Thermanaerovibrio velox DSM 12556 TaxID=926567 RepID=H0UP83_9BACT|nr:sigma factor-like helix-turn-helix DNA-binding protein [Thermanaerovibrio velox]EHM09496.1 hypothetical protein TheveDRAFT_0326 [Thermanaerovibrio velox DSM 12556]